MSKPGPRLALLLGALVPAWAALAWSHVRHELANWQPPRTVSRAPLAGRMREAQDVRIAIPDATLAAWFVAPTQGSAAVIVVHGASATREHLALECNALAQAGLGVLAVDLPGHGESTGDVRPETQGEAVLAALSWLHATPGIDGVGALGSSLGAGAVWYAAARSPKLAALASVAGESDAFSASRFEHGALGPLSWLPPVIASTLAGLRWSRLAPIEGARRMSARPVLIVHGDRDRIVPAWMAQALFDAVGQPKTLWLIEGAGHTDFAKVAGDAYATRLAAFFTEHLGGGAHRD